MFRDELKMFAASCRSDKSNELSADNGNVTIAIVGAALRSVEQKGRVVQVAGVIDTAHRRLVASERSLA